MKNKGMLLLLLLLLLSFSAWACDDEDKKESFVPSDGQSEVDGEDTGSDTGVDLGLDLGEDTPRDTSEDPGVDTGIDTAVDMPVDTYVPPPEEDDWICNYEERVAACQSPLLNDGASMPTDPEDFLYYVNRWYSIPGDYPIASDSLWTPCVPDDPGVPHDLICIPSSYGVPDRDLSLRQVAWESDPPAGVPLTWDGLEVGHQGKVGFKPFIDAARAEMGTSVQVRSSFRSYAYQEQTFAYWVSTEVAAGYSTEEATMIASTYSAQPGHSEHQLATTCDLTLPNDATTAWMAENAHRFGIVLTYEEHRIETTQYIYEPWHFRFVGVEAANAMRSCDLNTEEFLNTRYGVGALPEYEGESLILFHDSRLLAAVSPEPGAWFEPGAEVEKIWQIENSGTINWHHYSFEQVGGDDLGGAPLSLACVPAGDGVEISLSLQAPEALGSYESRWQVLDEQGTPLGETFVARILVSDGPPEADPYHFVRIDDLSNATGGSDPGADIDAVVLQRGSDLYYADAVESYLASPSTVRANDPSVALGAPDSFVEYPDVTNCLLEGYVSLGGAGTLVLRMGEEIQPTDRLSVLEVGGCQYEPGAYAVTDLLEVLVSVSPEMGGQWVALGQGVGPELSFTVPELPAI